MFARLFNGGPGSGPQPSGMAETPEERYKRAAQEVLGKGRQYERKWQWGAKRFGGPFQTRTVGKRLGRLKLEGGVLKWHSGKGKNKENWDATVPVKFGGHRG